MYLSASIQFDQKQSKSRHKQGLTEYKGKSLDLCSVSHALHSKTMKTLPGVVVVEQATGQ